MTKKSKNSLESALGQFYGYGLQEARFLHHLLRARAGDTIALECIDDVSGVKGGESFAEQDKSGLAHNPISDSAIDLWKTFANWLEGRRKGEIPSGTKFVLFVAQPYRGKIAEKMSACLNVQDAKALMLEIREKFWGAGPAYAKRAGIPEKLAKYLNVVLSARDSAIADIVKSFTLECGSGSPYEDIAAEIASAPVGAENVEPILNQLAGWVRTSIFKQIEDNRAVAISRDDFFEEYLAITRKLDRADTVLASYAQSPSCEEVQAELLGQTYVRQLHLIEADDNLIYDAINAYLLASKDRTEWAKRGYIHRSSLEEYEAALTRTWRAKNLAVAREMKGKGGADVGAVLLSRCLDAEVNLQGKRVPSHFTPGSFHKLANTLDVGWHPDFSKLLAGEKDVAHAA